MVNKSGFINVIKPTGMTSADVVFAVKKKLKIKKIGHLGTLDPAATGVLPIAIGKATKFFDYFLDKDKVYIARVKFGVETDTLDSYGKIISVIDKSVSSDEILSVLPNFMGEVDQIPPKYSAVKINGKKACDLARENINFEIKAKKIQIHSIELLESFGNNEFMFRVHCSAGTYIRTLFSDIAHKLNNLSTTTAILRMKSGCFDISSASLIENITEESIMSIEKSFNKFDKIEVNEIIAKKLINGIKVDVVELNNLKAEEFFVSFKKVLIGFYKIENNQI